MTQPFLQFPGVVWMPVKDGDPRARKLFRRHYSYRPYADGRDPSLFVGLAIAVALVAMVLFEAASA